MEKGIELLDKVEKNLKTEAELAQERQDLVEVKLLFDYWTGKTTEDGLVLQEERLKAGQTVTLPRGDALKLLDKGKAERTDPLP
jgi:hypothetical protein